LTRRGADLQPFDVASVEEPALEEIELALCRFTTPDARTKLNRWWAEQQASQ
jgi:hypothetical protein